MRTSSVLLCVPMVRDTIRRLEDQRDSYMLMIEDAEKHFCDPFLLTDGLDSITQMLDHYRNIEKFALDAVASVADPRKRAALSMRYIERLPLNVCALVLKISEAEFLAIVRESNHQLDESVKFNE